MNGPGTIWIRGQRTEKSIELIFRDSGPGFDPSIVDHIMDPFFTTKDGGTGLGLPIVNSIIVSHGGKIALENDPEGGAVIRVELLAFTKPEQAVV